MADYYAEVMADSPVFLAKLDEASGAAIDSVGGKTGTETNVTLYRQTGPSVAIPWGISFSTTGRFEFTDHADFDLGDGPFTIEAWFKRADTTSSTDLLGKGSAVDTSGYTMAITSTDRVGLRFGDSSQHVNQTGTPGLVDDTNWHHGVVVRPAATTGLVYVDGVNTTTSLSTAGTFTDNNISLFIGRRYTGSGSHLGVIAAVAIYKSALNSTRVAAHYAARDTLPSDSSQAAYIGGGFF